MTSKFVIAVAATAPLLLAAPQPAVAGSGGKIGAGIAGFAAGAFLGGAHASQPRYYGPRYYEPDYYAYEPAPVYGRSVRWCMRHYRSYDPRSGTYLGYDGQRHPGGERLEDRVALVGRPQRDGATGAVSAGTRRKAQKSS